MGRKIPITLDGCIKNTITNDNGCMIWQGYKNRYGYGVRYQRVNGKFTAFSVHRFVYEQINGKTDLLVCHHCDVPACINPAHLFAGTPKQNMEDKCSKGRWRGPGRQDGERNNNSKFKDSHIINMIEDVNSGMRRDTIQAKYNVSSGYLSRIVNKKSRVS